MNQNWCQSHILADIYQSVFVLRAVTVYNFPTFVTKSARLGIHNPISSLNDAVVLFHHDRNRFRPSLLLVISIII